MFEDREFRRVELLAGAVDVRQFVVGVDLGARVAGEMLAATGDPLGPQACVERPGQRDDLLDGFAVTAALERVVGLVVERNIEHGAEVQVEPEKPQQPPGDFAVALDERGVALVPQLLGVGRFAPDLAEPGNAPPFLVDRDDRLDRREVAQIVDQLAKLRR